jgi:putative tryptophan/tyrosine transport system substrate-binding protein
MRRREFITLVVGGAAAGLPFARRTRAAKLPTVGFLGPLSQSTQREWTAAFVQRMREHGWIEGHTVVIEYRWAEGVSKRIAEMAAELVRLKVDVIVTAGTEIVIALKQATSTIPIVFAATGDPVGAGLVASLARPGGNVTGISNQSADIASKRVGLLREIVPNFRRLAVMANAGSPIGTLEMGQVQAAARTLGVEVVPAEIRRADDIAPVIEALKGRADGLYVVTDPLVNTNRVGLNGLALNAQLPTIYGARGYVEAGGLMSYGADFADLWRLASDLVDKILRGAKPAELPVEQPTKFELFVNLKTAKALGLKIPEPFLLRADKLIE